MINEDIICAISTPPGVGGIAVVRLSGEGCMAVVDKIFVSKSGKKMVDCEANKAYFGEIYDAKNLIDEVLVTAFHDKHSYTGEESIEISCHGSLFIQQKLLQLLIRNGSRLAKPGEYTQRAFLNGKMDLSQAEAVGDLIESESAAAHRMAINQMKGGFSKELLRLRSELLEITSLLELELDFSEEDVEFADRKKLLEIASGIKIILKNLCESFSLGNAIKNGIPVAIVGHSNVGKSTLLNTLLKEDKAIVSKIAGTTRDVIEDTMVINGVNFRFIDTAGIRTTTDEVENIGIERTFNRVEKAQIVLFLIDATEKMSEEIKSYFKDVCNHLSEGSKLICVINKCDKAPENVSLLKSSIIEMKDNISQQLETSSSSSKNDGCFNNINIVEISAKQGNNVDKLIAELMSVVNVNTLDSQSVIVSNVRHYEALSKAEVAIDRVIEGLHNMISGDFVSQDIRECLFDIAEVTGDEITTDEVLGVIFSKFCVGK